MRRDHDVSFRMRGYALLVMSGVCLVCMVAQRRTNRPDAVAHTAVAMNAPWPAGRMQKSGDCDALLRTTASEIGVELALLRAVAAVESACNARAVSAKGARGVMQLMPRTARAMGVQDVHDPKQNIRGGALYLRQLSERWKGDLVLTIASYNAGPGAVARFGGIPPFAETQRYVRRVLARYEQNRAEEAAASSGLVRWRGGEL
jgi:soluble lytic murein transglycosylase-like protein